MNKRALIPLAFALAAALGGCTASPAVESSTQGSLVTSKSPTQLLRNQAISRIPIPSVQSTDEITDGSVACLSEAEDPDGKSRAWVSTFVAEIVSGNAFRVDAIAANLAQSFTDEDWTGTVADDGSISLTSESIPVSITITPVAVSDVEAHLLFEARGACVPTGGANSDEVRNLESPPA
jgi:hypothetical protein